MRDMLNLGAMVFAINNEVHAEIRKEGNVTCPKCGQSSGDAWMQCLGGCPMPMSPYYEKEEEEKWTTPSKPSPINCAPMVGCRVSDVS